MVGFSASAVQTLTCQNRDYNTRSLNKKASGSQYFIMALLLLLFIIILFYLYLFLILLLLLSLLLLLLLLYNTL